MTPAEKFNEVLDKYEYRGVEPIDSWSTDDLIDLQEAIAAELQDRDNRAQQEYFDEHEEQEEWQCNDPLCPCNAGDDSVEDEGSYGGTI